MPRVRRINVSQIEGESSNGSNKRPKGEIALYEDNNGGFDLVIQDGVNSTNANKVLGKGKFYGHNEDSGDGNGFSTIKLIPDIGLYDAGSDQYIIVDPTFPNHIHLRAGGAQDASVSDLFLGSENTHVKVSDQQGSVSISASGPSGASGPVGPFEWNFGLDGGLQFPDTTMQYTAWGGGRLTSEPSTSIGATGDITGDLYFSSSFIYYCTQNYNGVDNIWKRVAWSNDTW